MRYLFTKRGEAALATLLQRRPLLAFDFDGTLAPIVARPEDARVPAALSTSLAALAGRVPVAIVTGRSVGDARSRLGFVPQYIVGNHGAEDEHALVPRADLVRAVDPLRQVLAAHAARLASEGVQVEDKELSIALHYRRAPRRDEAVALIRELIAQAPSALQVFGGKMVVNAIAPQAPDKAEAVRRLQSRCGADGVFFMGDDVNDEPVFAAAQQHWLTVRIGRDDPASQAQFFLRSAAEVAPLLERMLGLLAAARK